MEFLFDENGTLNEHLENKKSKCLVCIGYLLVSNFINIYQVIIIFLLDNILTFCSPTFLL